MTQRIQRRVSPRQQIAGRTVIPPIITVPLAPPLQQHKLLDRDEVYVVGPGPSGRVHWEDIPHDVITLVVNSAICIPELQTTFWFVKDTNCAQTPWWSKALQVPTIRVWDPQVQQACGDLIADYTLQIQILPELVGYGGSTITGWVLQYLYELTRVKHIILCGIDMVGRNHYDLVKSHNMPLLDNGQWPQIHGLQRLIDVLVSRGITVSSLSPTALKVPLV